VCAVNAANRLSTGGEVATAYAGLLEGLWDGRHVAIAPVEFHTTLARHQPRFATHEQQDNQEFLVALLDHLHEDCNQGAAVLDAASPPPTSMYRMASMSDAGGGDAPAATPPAHSGGGGKGTAGGETVAAASAAGDGGAGVAASGVATGKATAGPEEADEDGLARAAWRTHLQRNRSIIADKFQGQQLCRTVCPTPGCGYVARTFEPVMYLSLPLPAVQHTWRVHVVASIALQDGVDRRHNRGVNHRTLHLASVPLLSRHTVVTASTGTVGEMRGALTASIVQWLLREGGLAVGRYRVGDVLVPTHPASHGGGGAAGAAVGASTPSAEPLPFEVVLSSVLDGAWMRPLADGEGLQGFRSSNIVCHLLPLAVPGEQWRMVPFLSRHRRWVCDSNPAYYRRPDSLDRTAVAAEPALAEELATCRLPDDAPHRFVHAVLDDSDCADLPEVNPDFFIATEVPARSVPFLMRVCGFHTLADVRDVATLWAAALWQHRHWGPSTPRSAAGVGVSAVFASPVPRRLWPLDPATPPKPPKLQPYAPQLLWTDCYGRLCAVCGRGAYTSAKPCAGCRLPAAAVVEENPAITVDTRPGGKLAEDAVVNAALATPSHELWGLPALAGNNWLPPALTLQWYWEDDFPNRSDWMEVKGVWDAYAAARAARQDALPAVRAALAARRGDGTPVNAAAAAAPVAWLPDPMAWVPRECVSWPVRGMTFRPPCVDVDFTTPTPSSTAAELASAATSVPSNGTHARPRAGTDGETEVTLAACLDLYSREVALSDGNLYDCPRCRCKVAARQSTTLVKPPEIMVIVLKRFVFLNEYGDTDKVNTLVDFPVYGLNMAPWVRRGFSSSAAAGTVAEPLYDLFAVCHHSGTLTGGHYTASARSPLSGRWFAFNDTYVRPLSAAAVEEDASAGAGAGHTQSPAPASSHTVGVGPVGSAATSLIGGQAAPPATRRTVEEIVAALDNAGSGWRSGLLVNGDGVLSPGAGGAGGAGDDLGAEALRRYLVTPSAYVLMYRRRPTGAGKGV